MNPKTDKDEFEMWISNWKTIYGKYPTDIRLFWRASRIFALRWVLNNTKKIDSLHGELDFIKKELERCNESKN